MVTTQLKFYSSAELAGDSLWVAGLTAFLLYGIGRAVRYILSGK
jgi:hypothetical protein